MFLADSVFVPDDQGNLTALSASLAEGAAPMPMTDMGTTLVKMLVTLLALILLMYASYWFLKRLIQNRVQKGVGGQSIEIIEKKMLSPKTMLYVVRVENKKILFAESHLEIKTLESFSLGCRDSSEEDPNS